MLKTPEDWRKNVTESDRQFLTLNIAAPRFDKRVPLKGRSSASLLNVQPWRSRAYFDLHVLPLQWRFRCLADQIADLKTQHIGSCYFCLCQRAPEDQFPERKKVLTPVPKRHRYRLYHHGDAGEFVYLNDDVV